MNTNLLYKNICINKYFYSVVLCCLFIISCFKQTNYYITLVSFVFISTFGYIIHVVSHIIDYNSFLNIDNNFVKNKYVRIVYKQFVSLIEFHTKTHHNSSINKKPINILKEIINNLLFQGVGLFIMIYVLKKMDISIFILWACLYTTIHIINYNIYTPEEHIHHHKDSNTNFGIDIYDIIFNTKNKNDTSVENYNHYSYNLIVLTVFFYYIHESLSYF